MNEQYIKPKLCLGILGECPRYTEACRDLGVAYKVLDISGPNWMALIRDSQCDAFLVRSPSDMSAWTQMYEERLRIVTHDLGQTIFPSYDELWFYGSQRRTHYWLEANTISHPRTWVYYDRHDAVAFADATPLPIVFECEVGFGATRFQVFRERGRLIREVNRYFKKGWSNVLFQEYVPSVTEWRVVRIGQSYMGYRKIESGESVIGSGQFEYECPPEGILDLVKTVTESRGFRSMALDLFETSDGRYLVKRLQPTFGVPVEHGLTRKDGKPGRFMFDETLQVWRFEEGLFCQNELCSVFVQALVEQLGVSSTNQAIQTEGDGLDEV